MACRFASARGKGSHGMLYFGSRRTVVPDLKRELKTGTLRAMHESRFTYPASLRPASRIARREKGYLVRFRDLPEAITQGDDLQDALVQAADCLEEAIAARIVADDGIPSPSRPARGERIVPLPAQMAAKAALYLAMRQAGISNVELARRLGCDEKDVRRLLNPRYGSKLPRIDAALAALGKRIEIVLRDAT